MMPAAGPCSGVRSTGGFGWDLV